MKGSCFKKQIRFIILLVTLLIFCGEANASPPSFIVRPFISEEGGGVTESFFNLRTYPGMEKKLEVELINHGELPIQIRSSIHTASTSHQVTPIYGPNPIAIGSTVPHFMEEIIHMEGREFTLEPHSSLIFPLQIQMPMEPYDGVLAGGIYFQMVDEGLEEVGGIRSLFGYTIAILLWQGEEVFPELLLQNVTGEARESQIGFCGELQNIKGAFINQVSITTQVIKLTTGEVILEESHGGEMQIAPHSSFIYSISAEVDFSVEEGYYRVKYIIESESETWSFQEDVWIEVEVAREGEGGQTVLETTESDYFLEESMTPKIALFFVIAFVAVVAFFVGKSNNS